jgi:hypothetical protein
MPGDAMLFDWMGPSARITAATHEESPSKKTAHQGGPTTGEARGKQENSLFHSGNEANPGPSTSFRQAEDCIMPISPQW